MLKLEISYKVLISWRILVYFKRIFWRLYFLVKYLNFHKSCFAFRYFLNLNGKPTVWHIPCFPCFLKSHTPCDQTRGSSAIFSWLYMDNFINNFEILPSNLSLNRVCICTVSLSLSTQKRNEGDVVAAALENKSWPAELERLLCLASNSKWGPESYIPYQFHYKDRVRKIIIQIMSKICCRNMSYRLDWMCEELVVVTHQPCPHNCVPLGSLTEQPAPEKKKVPFRLHQTSI